MGAKAKLVAETAAMPALTEEIGPAAQEKSAAHASAEGPPEPARQTLSIIIPIYNERQYVEKILERVQSAPIPPNLNREIIVVDDGSTDGTTMMLETLGGDRTIKIHRSILNFGKGTAIRVGLHYATGEYILIQDADLEYDPNDYEQLLLPLLDGRADVVYGSRFIGKVKGMRWQNYLANRMLSLLSNVLYGAHITDEATGYKVFRRKVLDGMALKCKRFEFCPEITARVRKAGFQIYEVPISYEARTAKDGKKIKLRDAWEAFYTLVKYRVVR
ncbi:MAG TPA: glycosyltransferase family 2 protein [Candidatus Acidoferrales bacterium]|jgi:glycosyltransferase involved in cell wall biosynthesis|nr:glycosyltransferase family 2 protein [Candidatus Acidoferrales bacterium]